MIYDTSTGADLTVLEEANELIKEGRRGRSPYDPLYFLLPCVDKLL
jgi:hypothetical protein